MTTLTMRSTPTRRLPSVPTKPVNVCFLIDTLSRAGTETQLLALIRELDRSRVRPTLVLLDGTDPGSRELEPLDCPILRLGLKRLCQTASIPAARQLMRFWHDHAIDVLQVYFLDSAYFAVPIARMSGIRRVVRVRNNLGYWLTPKHRFLNRIVGRLSDVTLTNTENGREALIREERLPADRVTVIPNGVDLERFKTPMNPRDFAKQIVVGCVANLRPVKNIDGLMRAARHVLDRFPQVRFEVAGDGEQRAELERLHTELQLGDRFRLLGSVADIPEFLRHLDIAVLPSHSEGMSNAILEYMAAGRAIVATDVGASKAVLGGCGQIVLPGDKSALADAIVQFVCEPATRLQFGTAARHRVEIEFSRDAMCRRFERFYRDLMRPRSTQNLA